MLPTTSNAVRAIREHRFRLHTGRKAADPPNRSSSNSRKTSNFLVAAALAHVCSQTQPGGNATCTHSVGGRRLMHLITAVLFIVMAVSSAVQEPSLTGWNKKS